MKKFLIKYRNSLLIIADIVIIAASYIASMMFLNVKILSWSELAEELCVAVFVYEFYLNIFQMYKNMMRYEIGKDYVEYMFICFISTISISIIHGLIHSVYFGWRINVLSGIFIAGMFVLYRLAGRSVLRKRANNIIRKEEQESGQHKIQNLLVIGAGMGAREIIISIKNNLNYKYNIVGIIDDNINKVGHKILGVSVLGTRYEIPQIVKEKKVDIIFMAINRITPKSRKNLIEICQKTGVKTKVLPTTEEVIDRQGAINSLREVEIEDLLGRDEIRLDNKDISSLIKDKTVLVTGGGGSIGSELCRQIMKYSPKRLAILDIYENNLYDIELELKRDYPNAKIDAIVASVRDAKRLDEIFYQLRPEVVFHAAAHKHVPLMENSPLEAVKNNVFGTYNVANSADKYGVQRFILISTDKAVNPTNIMGASKRLCEMIIQAKDKVSNTEYAAVRFGNVLGSNGSVIPLFKKQIAAGGPVTVTDKEITRFFMTIPEAVALILQAATYAKGGEIFVLDMGEPVRIYDLAVSLIQLSGYEPEVEIPIKFTGLRPGEKLYEELLMSEEGLTATKNEKIFISKPMHLEMEELEEKLNVLRQLEYSNDYTKEQVKAAMHAVVPTYKEPEEVNEAAKKREKLLLK